MVLGLAHIFVLMALGHLFDNTACGDQHKGSLVVQQRNVKMLSRE